MPKKRKLPKRKRAPKPDLVSRLTELAETGQFQSIVKLCEDADEAGLSVESLQLLAMAYQKLNLPDQAIETLQSALDHIGVASNPKLGQAVSYELAKLCFECGRHDESAAVLEDLYRKNPGQVELVRNLVLALEKAGRLDEAASTCRTARQSFPTDVPLAFQLGDLQVQLERYTSAVSEFRECVQLDPLHESAWRGLVTAYRRLEQPEQIAKVLREWLHADPGNAVAEHLLAASDPQSTPDRASDDYVRRVFDEFAETFDEQLQSLEYAVPKELANILDGLSLPRDRSLTILDAGCGTGLMGTYLADYASRLVGVDLSSGMLERADGRAYDDLVCCELVEYLVGQPKRFDLIVSADTFNYFGELKNLFRACAEAMRGGTNCLLFTLEKPSKDALPGQPKETDSVGFRLNPTGRYSHQSWYVRKTLQEAGFGEISVLEKTMRKEAGKDVTGYFWVCRLLSL